MEVEEAAPPSNFKSASENERDGDTHTIPSSCSWFSWGGIHQIERESLPSFFQGSSISRTAKSYIEYRNFIINKYREDPSRRLTFTEVRKSLVGDVSLLHKVFNFLDGYGLINFRAVDFFPNEFGEDEVQVAAAEEGVPHGIRVVGNPNLLKPNFAAADSKNHGEIKPYLAPSASFSNVFSCPRRQEGDLCASCGDPCEEDRSVICSNCLKNGKSADDFRKSWMETEELLLFESAQKNGGDWDSVAKNVQSKTKAECISRLIEVPLINQSLPTMADQVVNGKEDMDNESQRRKKLGSLAGTDDVVMTQISRISSVLGQRITTAAAEATFSALCAENPSLGALFETGSENFVNNLVDYFRHCHNSEEERDDSDGNLVPRTLQIRAVAALALGTAAGHARFLGERDQEEMQRLMAVVVEAQLKKVEWKMDILAQVEEMMGKMGEEMDAFGEHVLGERMVLVERSLDKCSSKVSFPLRWRLLAEERPSLGFIEMERWSPWSVPFYVL